MSEFVYYLEQMDQVVQSFRVRVSLVLGIIWHTSWKVLDCYCNWASSGRVLCGYIIYIFQYFWLFKIYSQQSNMDIQHPNQSFQKQTSTYSLTATLSSTPTSLTLTLQDFLNWTIYSRQYNEADIGGQINRKMDVDDVFGAFVLSQDGCDEGQIQEKETGVGRLRDYRFGDVVDCDGLPCYKVEAGGKVTVYQSLYDRKAKRQMQLESCLMLDEVRKMNQQQILTQKCQIHKNKTFQKLLQTIQKYYQTIQILQKQSTALKQQQKISNKLNQQKILNLTKEVGAKEAKIKQLMYEQKLSSWDGWVVGELAQSSRDYFLLSNKKLKYISTNTWTQYIFNSPINPNQNCKFKLYILKSIQKQIMMGVVDYAKQLNQRFSHNSSNAICYEGYDGTLYPSNRIQGRGFKEGDLVEVEVDRVRCIVMFYVRGKLEAVEGNSMLADQSTVFMPFVEMYNADDMVEWVD